MADKAPDAFRIISEVAEDLDVPQHVLRFWESRFQQIRPMKRGGGRRYYRPDDVDLLRGIRHLLYNEGYTIRGVQRILREQGVHIVQSIWQTAQPPEDTSAEKEEHGPAAILPRFGMEDADRHERAEEDGRADSLLQTNAAARAADELPAALPEGRPLARQQLGQLEAALRELAECRRLLDAACEDVP